MNKTVTLYAARSKGNHIPGYIYDQKLVPEGTRGVKTVWGYFPSTGDMVHAKGLFDLMGIDFPEDTAMELEITVKIPRPKGWYAARMKDNSKKVMYWDGEQFTSGSEGRLGHYICTWEPNEYNWVSDTPIPDPFEEVK